MKRTSLFLFLIFISLFGASWSPVDLVPAFKNLRSDITSQLNELFGREVSVESVSGTIVNQIELNNVAIAKNKKLSEGTIIKAKRVIIKYNPFKLATSRGNIVPAISNITVIEPEIVVERSADDRWNMAALMPTVKNDNGKEVPLALNAVIDVENGRGVYLDHMGWGEPLKGRTFKSGIKDFNARIRISGNKISINGSATSVIENDIAYAKVKGNFNTKNGKYNFVVNANDVDIAKWGYYTMNIPHFKPISGKSDMILTMTNPPPRRKGQPILFDGKFYLRNGKAQIFDNTVDNIYGFVNIHDEDARFKNISGTRDGVLLVANGRLYDFFVANYDIYIDMPRVGFEKLKRPFPALDALAFSGTMEGRLHVGGNYADPLFSGSISPSGKIYGQNIRGDLNFSYEDSVLRILPSRLSALKGALFADGIVDLTTGVPGISIAISGESIGFDSILPGLAITDRLNLTSTIRGNPEKMSFDAVASYSDQKHIKLSGVLVSGILSADLSGKGISLKGPYLGCKFKEFKGVIGWDLKRQGRGMITAEGSADAENGFIGPEEFSSASLKFRSSGTVSEIIAAVTEGHSLIHINAAVPREGAITVHAVTTSAEAGDIRIVSAILPSELKPVAGKLNADVTASFEMGSTGMPDLSKMTATGTVSLEEGHLSYEKLEHAYVTFGIAGDKLYFGRSNIKSGRTDITWSGSLESGKNMDLDLDGYVDLGSLKPFTIKYGRLFGKAKLNAQVAGRIDNPTFNADFDLEDIRYNDIFLDKVTGKLSYDGRALLAEDPIKILVEEDEYELSGRLDIKKKPTFSIKFEAKKGDLNTAVGLADEINKEISTKQFFSVTGERFIVLDPRLFIFPLRPISKFYTSEDKNSLSNELEKAKKDSLNYARSVKEKIGRRLAGKFSGRLDIKGSLSEPSGLLEFRIREATFESYSFDEAFVKCGLENGTIEVDSLYLKKDAGTVSINGTYDPNGEVSLELSAKAMPVDFLALIFPPEKSFKGIFDMEGGIHGRSDSLIGWSTLHAADISFGGVSMDDVSSSINYRNRNIYIDSISFIKDGKRTSLSGKVPLESKGVDVWITMEGEGIGLLTLPVRELSWISGNGKGQIIISGILSRLNINGNVSVEDTALYFAPIDSNLVNINSSITIKDNVLTIEGVTAKWVGSRTQGTVNKLKAAGSVDLNNLFGKSGSVSVDLKLNGGSYVVDFPNLYKGDVELKYLTITGPISIKNPSNMPKLSCSFDLTDGVITLPDLSKKTKMPNMLLDMNINIGKNSYIVAGDIKNLISTDISNLLLNMEIEGQNIVVAGTLDSPMITGKTYVKQGTMNILNREFTLMSDDRQKEVYPANLEKIKDNTAVFSGSSMPFLNLAAEVNVKETEVVGTPKPGETPTYKTNNYLVISRITGIPYSEDKDNGLKLDFDAFMQDTSKQPTELVLAGLDQEEIKVLLLPDFIKGPLKINQKGIGEVDAGDVLADYLNSRLNSYLLRDVERKIAKSLDLESLTLEYNFGKDIRNMLSTKTQTEIVTQGAPETMYGIGAVKGFFDRFYIDMKYAQAVQEQSVVNKALLNYQLTYRLSPVLSVVYYREPFSFIEDQSDYYRVTLRLGYQL